MKLTADWINAPAAQAVCAMLTNSGYQALFVGGCVRNTLLAAPVEDIDIATDARPETVISLAQAAGMKPVPTGIEHGTVTVVTGGTAFEVTTFRQDIETFGRHATVTFSTDPEQDARRRDFTMNALYARPDGTVYDPLGGLRDLRDRRVRFIEDPERRIREDYLRILRFFRFHAWYGDPAAELDADALAAVAVTLDGLATLSCERLGAEIRKLLRAPEPSQAVAAMRAAGVLAAVLPGADDMFLAPLVHLEAQTETSPDALRRLAVLGGQDVAERLRLSRAEARRLEKLHEGACKSAGYMELGYRYGLCLGVDIALIRMALRNAAPSPDFKRHVAAGAAAEFPVRAAHLMPYYTGPALGARLRYLEARWIDSGFTLSRDELLRMPP